MNGHVRIVASIMMNGNMTVRIAVMKDISEPLNHKEYNRKKVSDKYSGLVLLKVYINIHI